MSQKNFKRAATTRKFAAITLTLAFHAVLVSGIMFGGNVSSEEMKEMMPDVVLEWFGQETEDVAEVELP